jgi:hypothetical protein
MTDIIMLCNSTVLYKLNALMADSVGDVLINVFTKIWMILVSTVYRVKQKTIKFVISASRSKGKD